MAVWSEVRYPALFPGVDLSAEHYHPDKLDSLRFLTRVGRPVSSVARSIRQLLTLKGDDDTPVLDLGAANNHVVQAADAQAEDRVSTKKIVRAGDILVSRLRSYLKQVAIVPPEVPKAYVSTEFIVLRGDEDTDIAFLLPFLLSGPVQTVLAWSQDGNEHPRFNENVLLSLTISPTVEAIASKLNTLVAQAASDYARGRNDALSEAATMLVSALGLDKLDLAPRLFYEVSYKAVSAAGRVDSEHYQPKYAKLLDHLRATGQAVRLGDHLCESPTRGLQPLYDEAGDVLVINSQHVGTQSIDLESTEKTTAAFAARSKGKGCVRQHDVLLNSTGYVTIGRCQAMFEDVAAVVDSHVTILRPKPELDPVYLAMFLNTQPGFLQTERGWTGSSGQIELRLETIQDFTIWLAPKDIQQAIRTKVEAAHNARREARRLLEEAKALVEMAILAPSERKP